MIRFGPVVQRQIALAESVAVGEQAREDREMAERAERVETARRDAAVQAAQYRAESAGDHVDALSIARGQIPSRSLADVLRESAVVPDPIARDLSAPYGSEANPAVLIDGQEMPPAATRSGGWPSSEAELDRMLADARRFHDELVAYRARHDYQGAVADYGRKAGRGWAEITRIAVGAFDDGAA